MECIFLTTIIILEYINSFVLCSYFQTYWTIYYWNKSILEFHSYHHTYRIILKMIDSWGLFSQALLLDHMKIWFVGFILTTAPITPCGNVSTDGFHSYDHFYWIIWKYIDLWVSLLRPHLSDLMEKYWFVGFILTTTLMGPYRLTIWTVDIDWPLSFLQPHLSDHVGICQVLGFIFTTTLPRP